MAKKTISLLCVVSCILLPMELQAQHVNHVSGIFIRFLLGAGIGQIDDPLQNPVHGTTVRSSLAIGGFLLQNFALHGGIDYTDSPNAKFKSTADKTARNVRYNYLATTAGITYFFPRLSVYASLEGRLSVGGTYSFEGSLDTMESVGTLDTIRTKREGSFERYQIGGALILGTEEWFVTNRTGLGLALTFSGDHARRHTFYGLLLSVIYN